MSVLQKFKGLVNRILFRYLTTKETGSQQPTKPDLSEEDARLDAIVRDINTATESLRDKLSLPDREILLHDVADIDTSLDYSAYRAVHQAHRLSAPLSKMSQPQTRRIDHNLYTLLISQALDQGYGLDAIKERYMDSPDALEGFRALHRSITELRQELSSRVDTRYKDDKKALHIQVSKIIRCEIENEEGTYYGMFFKTALRPSGSDSQAKKDSTYISVMTREVQEFYDNGEKRRALNTVNNLLANFNERSLNKKYSDVKDRGSIQALESQLIHARILQTALQYDMKLDNNYQDSKR